MTKTAVKQTLELIYAKQLLKQAVGVGVIGQAPAIGKTLFNAGKAGLGFVGSGIGEAGRIGAHASDAAGLTSNARQSADNFTRYFNNMMLDGGKGVFNNARQAVGLPGGAAPPAPAATPPAQQRASAGSFIPGFQIPPQAWGGPQATPAPQSPPAAPPAAPTVPAAPITNPLEETDVTLRDGSKDTSALLVPEQPIPPAVQPPAAQPPANPQQPAQQPVPQRQAAPAQPAPSQQPAQQSAQPAEKDVDPTPYLVRLRDKNATPEALEQARTEYVDKFVASKNGNLDPKLVESMRAWTKDPNSAAAQMANDYGFKALLQEELAKNPGANADTFGQIVGQVSEMWNNMDGMSKMGLMVGVPAAMVGLLGGNGMSMLIGALGIGLAGAGSGLFGQTAQQFTQDASSYLGSLAGGESAPPAAPPAAPSSPTAGTSQQTGATTAPAPPAAQSPSSGAASSGAVQITPQKANDLAAKLITYVKNKDNRWNAVTNGPAALAARGELFKMTDDQIRALHAQLSDANKNEIPGVINYLREQMQQPGSNMDEKTRANIERIIGVITGSVKTSATLNIMRKAARCWAGYEPVPGTKAYSEGSCRPKGSKKTQKEVIRGKKHEEKKAVNMGRNPAQAQVRRPYRREPLTPMEAYKLQQEIAGMEIPQYGDANAIAAMKAFKKRMSQAGNAEQVYGAVSDFGNSTYDYTRGNDYTPFHNRIKYVLDSQHLPERAEGMPKEYATFSDMPAAYRDQMMQRWQQQYDERRPSAQTASPAPSSPPAARPSLSTSKPQIPQTTAPTRPVAQQPPKPVQPQKPAQPAQQASQPPRPRRRRLPRLRSKKIRYRGGETA
jgi:hypothetical protein